ncbi:unnamed protein product [Rotaria sp. Silwood2]|nr:unnamed protein product [Rotaria sp. Silwood2]CAF3167786.1 unnamed protein product [Rotaria sp. Silwood2]CAF3852756.1 unnamed protein product [Rotaria sp. Silwood2]CAF4525107.1 unnamed protein product [Rotaria sp. Silwood2]
MASTSSITTDEFNPRFTVDDVGDPNTVLRPIEGYPSVKKLSLFRNLERDKDEILLLPGTYLEVIEKAKLGEGLHIIRMREVNPSHVLLGPPIRLEITQNIEFILDSVYEVNKENDVVPKLFIVLPDPLHPWNQGDPMKNKFLLHFISECSIDNIHLANYPGYPIPYSSLFFEFYSQYMQQFMIPLAKHLFKCR